MSDVSYHLNRVVEFIEETKEETQEPQVALTFLPNIIHTLTTLVRAGLDYLYV